MIRAALGAPVTWGEVLAAVGLAVGACLYLWGRNGFRGTRERR